MDRIFGLYGFKLVDREEAQSLGLPEGSGLFQELFNKMMIEIQQNKYSGINFGSAANMKEFEKKISFLNRYFVYKKIRNVNASKVEIDMKEYNDKDVEEVKENEEVKEKEEEKEEEKEKEEVKEEIPKPRKIRKLTKKLLLVPASEAADSIQEVKPSTKQTTRKLKIVK